MSPKRQPPQVSSPRLGLFLNHPHTILAQKREYRAGGFTITRRSVLSDRATHPRHRLSTGDAEDISPAELLEQLEGRPWEIAKTIKREIEAIAPYAELGLALGVPTWQHFDRVVSLITFPDKCALHFWQGDALDQVMPGVLEPTAAQPMRRLVLGSMLDVNERVKNLLKAAFELQISHLASE